MATPPAVPGYALLDRLGGGPCCDVYSAAPAGGGPLVAVKTLRADAADDPRAVMLLRREARAGFAVRHKNLVPLLDAHTTRRPFFLVMELLAGESAKARVRAGGALLTQAAIAAARQAAGAIAAVHAAGYVHGDVKSDNIRLVSPVKSVVVDLGFAHQPGEHAAYAAAGFMMGTPNYMAPELCAPPVVDTPAADVFALGVTLFELLTGTLPYPTGTAKQVVRRRRTDESAKLPAGEWPTGLPELVEEMTSRDPLTRPRAKQVVTRLTAMQILGAGRRAA